MSDFNGAVATAPRDRLLNRLDDERTVAALERLLDNAELLAFSATALDGFIKRGDQIADNVGQSVAELKQLAPEGGESGAFLEQVPRMARAGAQFAEVAERPAVQRLLDSGLIEKLGDPKTLTALNSLLQHVELLAFLGEAADGFLRRGDTVIEAVAESVGDLRTVSRGSDLAKALPALQKIAKVALEKHTLEAIVLVADAAVPVVESGLLDPELVRSVADAGATLAESYEEARAEKPRPMGPLALFSALRDPDVQRTMGFAVAVAKKFGQRSREQDQRKESLARA